MTYFNIFLALVFLLPLSLVQAQSTPIDSMVAIVEDDVITAFELNKELTSTRQRLRRSGRKVPADSLLKKQVLDLMINQSILQQEANNRGITITDTQLNNAMQNVAKNNKMSLSQFRDALISQNIDYIDFRNNLRDQLATNSLKRRYARSNVKITDKEVNDFIKHFGNQEQTVEYHLGHILIALDDGASSKQVTEASKQALQIHEQIQNGSDFSSLASKFSEGSNALEGGSLGWRKFAEVPSLFSNLVLSLNPGDTNKPIRSASGFHIVKLIEKRDADQVLTQQTHARHILIKTDTITTSEQARERLLSIRNQIIQGVEFSKLAKKYSDDTGSGGLGGDLGWFSSDTMVPAFAEIIESSNIGEVSEPFKSHYGWHILEVLGRKTVDETEESKRNKIRAQLEKQKQAETLELWQRRLRGQAFIKTFDAS